MAKKQKLLRNLLTGVSVASIIASIGGNNVAFAEDAQVGVGAKDLSVILAARLDAKPTDWVIFNEDGGRLTVDGGSPAAIPGISVRKDGATITIDNNITIGEILNDGSTVTATINAGRELTLGENNHTGLGVTTLDHRGSTLILQNGATINSDVVANVDSNGVLTFEGTGISAGAIGTAAASLAEININGAAVVTLQKDVFTRNLNFAVAGSEVQIAGNFGGGGGVAGEVDFGAAGGMLTFNAALDKPKTFNSTIVNGDKGILNVRGDLTATNAHIGKINAINIGTARGGGVGGADPSKPGTLSINASAGNVDLLNEVDAGPRAAITFLDKESRLKLYIDDTAGADRTITFHKDLPGFAGGGGTVVLQGTNANTLTLQSNGGPKTLGTDAAKLDELQVRGKVTINGDGVNKLDIHNINALSIIKDAVFTDESGTSAQIANVHIGAGGGAAAGRAIYILDAKYANVDILNGKTITFDDATAQLTLKNSAADNKIITFYNDLEGAAVGGGVVLLESTDANTLVIRSNDGRRTLGTADRKIEELQVRGKVDIAGGNTIKLNVSNTNVLNIIKGAVFTDRSTTSAQIANVNIGATDDAGTGKATYILDVRFADLGILAPNDAGNNNITFKHATAQLTLRNSDDVADSKTITFHNDLAGFSRTVAPIVNHGGIVSLETTNGKTLIVQSVDGTKTLGTNAHKIRELQVHGQVTIKGKPAIMKDGAVVAGDKLDVRNTLLLNIMNGATFTDESATSAKIADIHIGADAGAGAGLGLATYVLDAVHGNFGILNASIITFDHAASQLILRNSHKTEDRTITFDNSLAGFNDPTGAGGGIVSLENTNNGTLFVQSAGGTKALGIAVRGRPARKIGELQVRGNVTIRGEVGINKLDVRNVKILNVMKGAIFLDESATSAKIGEINIGADGGGPLAVAGVGQANYIIDTKYNDNVEILNGKTITFKAADAQLTLRNSHKTEDRTIIFHDHLAGFSSAVAPIVDHGGIVSLESENGGTLFVRSSDGTKTLGTAAPGGHNIGELQVRGKVTIAGIDAAAATIRTPANRLDVSNAKILNVINRAIFTDESATSAQIATINIGADDGVLPPIGGIGPADYILDAAYNEFTILANAADQINFLHEDAQLTLQNSANDNKTITLTRDLDPGVGRVDPKTTKMIGKGIVQLGSGVVDKTLTIKAGAAGGGLQSLGTNAHILKEIIITGAGQVVIQPTIYAKTIKLNVDRLTTEKVVNGNIEFAKDTAFVASDNIVGDINFFNKAGIVTLANDKTITGKVEGNNAGTLNFAGIGTVTGDIGEDGKPLNVISLSVGNVALQGNVFTENLNYYSTIGADGTVIAAVDADNKTVTIGGNFKGKVNFNATNENILTFNGVPIDPTTGDPKSYIFNSEIFNGNKGTLNVQTTLKATHANIGNIKIINIGTNAANHTLAINASAGNVNLLGLAGAEINFKHANSRLELGVIGARNDHSIIFENDLPGHAVNGGIIFMAGVDGATLTVQANGGNNSLGMVGAKLGHIAAFGKVIIRGDDGVNKLDIRNTGKLSIVHDPVNATTFTDESGTSAAIARIDIGQSYDGAGGIGTNATGSATYVLDAKHANINILANGDQINFLHEDAQLTLQNSSNARDRTIILNRDLDPGAGGVNGNGIVELNSVNLNRSLTIRGVGRNLGTAANSLKEIIFSGNGSFNIDPAIHAKNVKLNAADVTLGDVNSRVTFARNTTFNVGNITGDVDFKNHGGTINLENNGRIAGSVTSTGGVDGTLVFKGIGEVTGRIEKLKLLRAGAGNVTLAAGNHSITEIQGNGERNLTFAGGFNLEGGINLTPGMRAVGLIFNGAGSISGGVGTGSAVGSIQIRGGTVAFGSSINAQDIDISNGATAEIVKHTIATNIQGDGRVKFNNKEELILDTPISINTMEVAGTNVRINNAVSGSNIRFSNSDPVTLTLGAASTVNNIETVGDEVHSMALAADFTATDNIGSESNRLKEIKLLGDHTFTIKGNSIYSPILTTTDNSGKVIFNLDDSVAYGNLGEEKVRLADVTFDSNSKVKADVYSKKITINADKVASFAGTNARPISIPGIPRLLKEFTYSTEIVSEEINAESSSKMQFDNAVLIKAPINGGQVILADNVWFKEEVKSATSVTFAPDKYVILEKNIAASNIEANQATIIILSEKQAITGELAAKNLTIDLGANQLKYAGNAKLTGELKLHSFYDSSKSAGGNIEIQSNSKLDLSQLDNLAIVIVGRSNINKISDAPKHVLISSVDTNGISALDPNKITLDSSGEQNRFVRWTIDTSSLTLDAQESSPQDEKDVSPQDKKEVIADREDISKESLEKDFADKPEEQKHFVNQLDKAREADRNSDAAEFRNELGLMEKDAAGQAVERLLSSNENPIGESIAKDLIVFNIIETMVIDIASQITSRSMNMQLPANMQVPVGAGDDDKMMYGVWGSPFYSIANQKMRKGVSGYKAKSAGGIVGFDSLINDDLLVGAAYSRIDTKMSHKNQKIGDKTSGKTNVFSVYGFYKFPANWFAEAIVSYGITNVKNLEGRIVPTDVRRITTLDTVVAKYKSTSYNGQLLAGYSYQPSEKLIITPTIGFRYSQFTDSGYTETGTAYQKLIVKKRSYNKFEGILGLRTATNIQLDQMLLIPELHGYVNYDFKGKTPVIDARLGGMDEPLPIKSVKPSKVSFTVGTGLTVKSNMMEYGVTYNAHIANKYIGHQGSLKVKVNF
ncbi:MAG: autotransporter outer membrane beta-barrel domain-containing protein [Rickettsia endosymbiont of Pseudomimeciton antennatum]|nr:autotransporter outer membrane beta-barrel domain-containing protein [Rickettsia endosymbiont of Pseudomimeciton antennatum]